MNEELVAAFVLLVAGFLMLILGAIAAQRKNADGALHCGILAGAWLAPAIIALIKYYS